MSVYRVAARLSSISLSETCVVTVVDEAIALHTSRVGNLHPTCRVILGTLRDTCLIFVWIGLILFCSPFIKPEELRRKYD